MGDKWDGEERQAITNVGVKRGRWAMLRDGDFLIQLGLGVLAAVFLSLFVVYAVRAGEADDKSDVLLKCSDVAAAGEPIPYGNADKYEYGWFCTLAPGEHLVTVYVTATASCSGDGILAHYQNGFDIQVFPTNAEITALYNAWDVVTAETSTTAPNSDVYATYMSSTRGAQSSAALYKGTTKQGTILLQQPDADAVAAAPGGPSSWASSPEATDARAFLYLQGVPIKTKDGTVNAALINFDSGLGDSDGNN